MKKSKKILAIYLLVLLVAGISGWLYLRSRNSTEFTDEINYAPPTKQEVAETEQHKDEVVEQTENQAEENQNSNTDNSSTKKLVEPVITYWGQETAGSDLEFNGRVPGVIENNGTCTLTLTKGSQKIQTKRTTLANAQDTSCGLMLFKSNTISAGDWTAVLSYSSNKSAGSSEPIRVKVN